MAMARRIGEAFALTNLVSTLLLLGGGILLSRLLSAPRFGLALVAVAVVGIVPLSLVLIVKPRFGVFVLFVVSMVVIEVKRLSWDLEVGLAIEFLELVLAVGLVSTMVVNRDARRLASPMTLPVLVYVLYQVVLAFHPYLPTVYNVIYSLRDPVNSLVPFLAAVYLVRDRKQLRFFLYLWLGTAVILALYGLKQQYLGLYQFEIAWLAMNPTHLLYDRLRIFSTLGSADALGMHMALSIVIALAVAFHTRQRKIRYPVLATIPLFLMVNMYTLTRGAYLAVLVGVLTLALITRNRAMLLALLIAALLVIGWYQANQGNLLANRVMTMFSPEEDASFAVRQNYLQDFLPYMIDQPFGFGPNTSGRQGWLLLEWGGVDPRVMETIAGVPTDNYYFRLALETGWVGLLLFLGVLASALVVGARSYIKAKDPLARWLTASFLACFVAMAVSSVSNNYFAHTELRLFYWFSLGILANLPKIEAESRDDAGVNGWQPSPMARAVRRW